jgi:3',5'-nucleoside bisphosphate phosphatase
MAAYAVDLHVHTVLSPCAEVEMIPPLIVETAVEVGLDMIAITDHNSAENVAAVVQAAEATSLKVIPGIECESAEGIHFVCLFDEVAEAMQMQEIIFAALPDLPNKPETFGAQFVVDLEGSFVRYNERLLLAPTELSIDQVVATVNSLNGLAIPAHVNRPVYGIYGVLGFLPEEPTFGIVEISRHLTPDNAVQRYSDLAGKKLLSNSDAHRLSDIGTVRTILELEHRTVLEIKRRYAGGS